jgi:hypothetical protein
MVIVKHPNDTILLSYGRNMSTKRPTTKCRLTMGIQPVNVNLRHPEGDPDPQAGSHPAHRS